MAEWDEMKKLSRGPYIDAFCQVWFHLVQLFQRSRLKYEKLTDRRRTPSDGNTSHDPLGQVSSKCYGPGKKILFKKQLFDLEVKGQGPTKVIMVHNTPPYGHAPTYQISLTYLERQKSYGPDKLR